MLCVIFIVKNTTLLALHILIFRTELELCNKSTIILRCSVISECFHISFPKYTDYLCETHVITLTAALTVSLLEIGNP